MMETIVNSIPLLAIVLALPFVAAALLPLMPGANAARWFALSTCLVGLLLSLALAFAFDPTLSDFQFYAKFVWIESLNVHYEIGLDGISILFLPLSQLLMTGIILASWTRVHNLTRLYFGLLLLLLGTTLGTFAALDTILFFLFWELTLIPVYFLTSLWGTGPNRRFAATKYTLLMMAGGIPILMAFVLVADSFHQNQLVFSYLELLQNPLDGEMQTLVFFLLLLGFAAKIPLFPLHTWLPVLAIEGPFAIGAFMTGLKVGIYGLIRFAVPLAPQAAQQYHWLLAALGVITLLYGVLLAMTQANLRQMLAYLSVSHVGLVVLGIASFTIQGFQGAVFQTLNFALISGGLFLIAGFVHHRTSSTDLLRLGGLVAPMPLLTTFFFFLGIASLGIPLTSGFPAELLILLSALETHTGAGLLALIGIILGAACLLVFYRRAFLGKTVLPFENGSFDLRVRELWICGVFSFLVLLAGLYPVMVLDMTESAGLAWIALLNRG